MDTSPIPFCSGFGDHINSTDIKNEILNKLTSYGITIKYNLASLLTNSTISHLKNIHYIAIKTTGTNYFLFLTKINNINYCVYIDRKIKQGYTCPRIIVVNYCFTDDTLFNDTLFDGEVVKDSDNNWMFLITDVLVNKSNIMKMEVVNIRFNTIYNILDNHYRENLKHNHCKLMVKKLFSYSDYNELLTTFIPKLTYGIRGLYFYSLIPKHRNYLFLYPKNKETLIKNKESSTLEIKTFEIRKTIQVEIYDLYVYNKGEIVKYDTARIPTLQISKLVNETFNKNKDNNPIYFYCNFNIRFNKWEPNKISTKDQLTHLTHL